MGKITGFLEYERSQEPAEAPRTRARSTTASSSCTSPTSRRRCRARAAWTAASRSACRAARSTTSSRTGTTWFTAATGSTRSTRCTRPTTSPSSPAAICPAPCEEACVLRINDDPVGIKSIEHAIIDKRLGGGLGGAAARAAQDRQEGRGGRLRARGPGLRAAARARRPRRHAVREERPHRRPAALRHPRLQDGEVAHRPAHRADGRPRASSSASTTWSGGARRRRQRQARPATRRSCSPTSTPWCSPAAPRRRATCRCPGASSTACTSRWTSCRCRTRRVAGDKNVRGAARRPASTSWSSAAATPARDCVGTSNRHGAKSVTQFELLPMPPDLERNPVWPYWPIAAAHLVLARGRRRARLGGRHQGVRRRGRQGRRR